jgi:Fanconi anemia group M protein
MIIIDSREKNSLVISELVEQNISFEFRQLQVADYVIGNIAIERKTISDFISSMLSKRLLRQLIDLGQYPKKLLIIEGFDEQELYGDNDKSSGINPNAIRGMLLSTVLKFQVPIIFTKDYADTAKFLILLEKRQEKGEKDISLRVRRKTSNIYDQQQMILEGFPGIGPSTAKALLKKFKTIKAIINANEKDLVKARLNKNKIAAMKKIIETKYKSG